MKIRDSPLLKEVRRKVYRRESAKKQSPEDLRIAGTYIARLIKENATRESFATDHEVYVNQVNAPNRRAPWKWLFPGTTTVELVPVGGSHNQALDAESPVATECIDKNGYLYERRIQMGMWWSYKAITGYLLPKDTRGQEEGTAPGSEPLAYDAPPHDPLCESVGGFEPVISTSIYC